MNTQNKKNDSGFIHIIIIVVIAVVILSFFGFDPVALWQNFALPILNGIWSLFIAVLNFIVTTVSQLVK